MKLRLSSVMMVLLLALGAATSRACQYCQAAAAGDPEAVKLAAQVHGESFPLEGVIGQYAAAPVSPTLSAPPPPASVVTQATDLPATSLRRTASAPAAVPASQPAPKPAFATTRQLAPTQAASWADVGLVGLLAAGGLFCWRTRRTSVPQP